MVFQSQKKKAKKGLAKRPKYGHFWWNYRTRNKESVRNGFLIFSLFSDYSGSLDSKSRKFQKIWPKSGKKSEKKWKYRKKCFVQIFVLFLSVTWQKMAMFVCSGQTLLAFLCFGNPFFWGISYTNSPKTALMCQLCDTVSQYGDKHFNSVKSFWKYVFQLFRTNQIVAK